MSYNPFPQPADVVVNTGIGTSAVSPTNPFPVTGTVGISSETLITINPDTNAVDAFGRNRVSELFTLGDYKHLYAIDPNFLDSVSGAGSSVSFIQNQAAARLQTGIGSTAVSYTHLTLPTKRIV